VAFGRVKDFFIKHNAVLAPGGAGYVRCIVCFRWPFCLWCLAWKVACVLKQWHLAFAREQIGAASAASCAMVDGHLFACVTYPSL